MNTITDIKKMRNKVKTKNSSIKKKDNEQFQKYKYGNMSLTPTSVTTTIVTKTTTTTEYPPLYFAPPELPEDCDSSLYPLANVPTPYNLKNFQFDLNGSPTYFKEIEIVSSCFFFFFFFFFQYTCIINSINICYLNFIDMIIFMIIF